MVSVCLGDRKKASGLNKQTGVIQVRLPRYRAGLRGQAEILSEIQVQRDALKGFRKDGAARSDRPCLKTAGITCGNHAAEAKSQSREPSVWAELCLPQTHMLKPKPPVPQNVTILGDGVFTEIK